MGLTDETALTVCYARVSSHDQKADLDRQQAVLEAYCAAKGWRTEMVRDLGSGMNYAKRVLQCLLEMDLRRQGDIEMGEYRRGQREGRPAWYAGFPRWRKRRVHDSYQADNGRGTVRMEGRLARLPSGGWVRMAQLKGREDGAGDPEVLRGDHYRRRDQGWHTTVYGDRCLYRHGCSAEERWRGHRSRHGGYDTRDTI